MDLVVFPIVGAGYATLFILCCTSIVCSITLMWCEVCWWASTKIYRRLRR